MRRYAVVRVAWDDEAKVWYVDSDIEGLATEADTLEELRRKVPVIIQDLLEDRADRPDEIELDFIAKVRLETHPDCASRRVSSMMEAA